ncbi:MAG: phosphate ABC transporter substrate-binding protein [Bacteroidota bacterium]
MKKFMWPTFFALMAGMAVTIAIGVNAAGQSKGSISIVGSTSVQPLAEELATAFMQANPQVRITVAGGGSGAGIKAVKAGQAEIGTSSRELESEERSGLTETVIARDGIAVIVHPKNSVTNLNLDQVAGIYSGRIKTWQAVGGANAQIVLVSREAGSGTRSAFEELVLGKTPVAANLIVQGSTGAVRQTVAISKNAIGYISMGQLDRTVRAVRINGTAATESNVLNKTYAVSRPFLFLTKGPAKGVVKAFLDFVLGPKGQAIVAKEFVPVDK